MDALPSYSDNFLLNFHNQDQAQKQSVSNSLAVWNEELQREQERIIEWQDSFQRNDLADFTPPMSSGLNCLMVGGEGFGGDNIKLPWEEEAEANVTPLRITTEEYRSNDDSEPLVKSTRKMDKHDSDESSRTQPSHPVIIGTAPLAVAKNENDDARSQTAASSSSIRVKDPTKAAAVYDCIVDQGLMDAVIALRSVPSGSSEEDNENNKSAIQELLYEAATAIREHGIYVLVTKSLSQETRTILEECSQVAGFEWHFELDGISGEDQVVSVGRRFCNGEMPKVGRLSRFQP